MDTIFNTLKFVTVYLDDILIASKTEKTHLEHIAEVLDRMSEFQLKIRIDKCKFFQRQLKYLGHVISAEGVSPDPEYMSTVLQMAIPTTKDEMRRFLGMVGWMRKFIPALSMIRGETLMTSLIQTPF